VFSVAEPFLKTRFVIVEDKGSALGGFHRQRLLPDLVRNVDQRLAAEATGAGFNRRIEINFAGHLYSPSPLQHDNGRFTPPLHDKPSCGSGITQRHWFGPMFKRSKVTVFADPVKADSADRDREQYDQADQDEANADVPRNVGH
jgi:hypothetical protein